METTLHRQLKARYASEGGPQEVPIDGYRIDVVRGEELIEIQQASLGALRNKIRGLLQDYAVRIVKPLAVSKRIVQARAGSTAKGRLSPRHEGWLHVFDDLVHFVDVFPHPRLTLEVLLTEQIELRVPRERGRCRGRNYRVHDRQLTAVVEARTFQSGTDLLPLLPTTLPVQFSTADLATAGGIPRWLAQRVAYCLRELGVAIPSSKLGNAWIYELATLQSDSSDKKGPRQNKTG